MPAVSWRTARAEIATILTGVAITDPITTSILRVFQTEPKQVSDFPCVVVLGTEKSPARSSGLRQREMTAHLRLAVQDADQNRAADIIDALQDAITDAFDANLTLNGKASNVNGPYWELPGVVAVGGQEQFGADCTVRITLYDDPVFAA